MKISKLFHWLYGILMLLPILVFIPNAFYYGFNEQAVAQEKTEQIPVYYDTNEVNSINDLIVGNIYHWSDNFNNQPIPSTLVLLNIQPMNVYNGTGTFIYGSSGNIQYVSNNTYTNIISTPFDFLILSYGNQFSSTPLNVLDKISKCENIYPNGEYQPLTTTMSITDSMSYAWDSVWRNDLFSWSYESFLAEPFKYIGNVFGLPNDNSIYYCLSYWLDISIIWLCFDLIMYVPLLVHRWIDKGVLE